MPTPEPNHRRELALGYAATWTMTADLLAAPLAWGLIGWLVDRWWGSAPVGLAIGLTLWAVLGFYLVYRRAQETYEREEARRPRI